MRISGRTLGEAGSILYRLARRRPSRAPLRAIETNHSIAERKQRYRRYQLSCRGGSTTAGARFVIRSLENATHV